MAFAGRDQNGNQSGYVMKDWLVFSTTDMKHWTQYPVPLKVEDFKWAASKQAYAGHVAERNGKYYWYVSTNWCGIGVAVSDKITGPYKDAFRQAAAHQQRLFRFPPQLGLYRSCRIRR